MPAPRHLALIPDGNRRWAYARSLTAAAGHQAGIHNATRIVARAWEEGVEVVSLWWGSPANFLKRPASEKISESLKSWLETEAPGLLTGWNARLLRLGRWQEFCPEVGVPVAQGAGPKMLVVLMAYDGREELLTAAQGLPGDASLKELESRLWTGGLPPVDLVVRTGGEPHLSAGFLLWGIAEAVLVFEEKLWPDFAPDDLSRAIQVWGSQHRRFGG